MSEVEPTALYRFYDGAGRLLYVGITCDPWTRFLSHQSKDWGAEADPRRTRIRWYRTRLAALRAESRAIRREQPAYNRTAGFTPRRHAVQLQLPLGYDRFGDGELEHEWFTLRWRARGTQYRRGSDRGRGVLVLPVRPMTQSGSMNV